MRHDLPNAASPTAGNIDPEEAANRERSARLSDKLGRALVLGLRLNPFVKVDTAEIGDLATWWPVGYAERDLFLLRQLASNMAGRRVAVFAMPKSGSSFIQTAIRCAAQIPLFTLTGLTADGGKGASQFGINGREQELDEMAVVLQTIRGRGSWVAQHHTCFNRYMAFQLRYFGIRPVVTVRNIFDAIVSMDDMLMTADPAGILTFDPSYVLPGDYRVREQTDRLDLLAQELGFWLIRFMVSWKRAINGGFSQPLIISYEKDVLTPGALAPRIGDYLGFGDAERAALDEQLAAKPGEEARFNKGIAGRGAMMSPQSRDMLRRYAEVFCDDLGDDGMGYLFAEAR